MNGVKIYAFADEACPNIDGQIKALKRNGLQGIEIRNVDGVNVSDISLEKAKEVKKKLDENGLEVWSVGSPIGKTDIENDDFCAHTEKLKHTLEVAGALDCKNIRIFSFYIPKGKNAEDYKSEVLDRVGQMCALARPYDISLCHENEKGIYGDISGRCLELYKALPELKGIFDPANFIQVGEDTKKAWELLKSCIYYIHIKDAKSDGTVVPAGAGCGNIEYIANDFIKNGGHAFTVEPHLTVFGGLSSLERKGEKSVIAEGVYPDADTAFDTACSEFKKLLCR